jgi:host factor-I protein
MEGEARNLQNDFFNEARKSRSVVTVFLGNGKKLTGRIKSFDKFTVLLENQYGELILFKHAIATVTTARFPADGPGEPERRAVHAGTTESGGSAD